MWIFSVFISQCNSDQENKVRLVETQGKDTQSLHQSYLKFKKFKTIGLQNISGTQQWTDPQLDFRLHLEVQKVKSCDFYKWKKDSFEPMKSKRFHFCVILGISSQVWIVRLGARRVVPGREWYQSCVFKDGWQQGHPNILFVEVIEKSFMNKKTPFFWYQATSSC